MIASGQVLADSDQHRVRFRYWVRVSFGTVYQSQSLRRETKHSTVVPYGRGFFELNVGSAKVTYCHL